MFLPIIDKTEKNVTFKVLSTNSGDDLSKFEKISYKVRNKVTCPFCDYISITSKEVRRYAREHGLGHQLIAVVEKHGKIRKYRSPLPEDLESIELAISESDDLDISGFGPAFTQSLPKSGQGASRGFTIATYGMNQWKEVFNPRQYWAVHIQMNLVREAKKLIQECDYPELWKEAISVYLNIISNQSAERNTSQCRWFVGGGAIQGLFDTYTLPIRWTYAESFPCSNSSGSLQLNTKRVTTVLSEILASCAFTIEPSIVRRSAMDTINSKYHLIITDPPYYDQIPYSDTLDFFYIMIRAINSDMNDEFSKIFAHELSPKWDEDSNDKELIDDAKRHDGNVEKSKNAYEDGMSEAFKSMHNSLEDNGRLVVVFAHKDPVAWETLISSLIRSGFQVTSAWPIRTEKASKVSSGIRAFLSTSIWIVLKKRDVLADYAFDRDLYGTVKADIEEKLRRFWDSGIRGPDFLWAALGPGLEIYSKYEVVRKFDATGSDELVSVSEFLDKIRDIVLRFSIGRLLVSYGSEEEDVDKIDDLTRYYLLHRSWFGFSDVESGEITKFAVGCGFTDTYLANKTDILSSVRGQKRRLAVSADKVASDAQADVDRRGGSKYVLNRWNERESPNLQESFDNEARPPSLIDHVHHLLHLRMEGDKQKMDGHIKHWALGNHPVMPSLVQALQELCKEENGKSSEELSLLESLSKDLERLAGVKPVRQITLMDYTKKEDD